MKTIAHIINHTHWDREWFLTSIYTSRWIPQLIDTIEKRVAYNPEFRYLLDGQTLVIEDLIALSPAYQEKVNALVSQGRLIIGPYYCQPDWRLTGGESLLRNLQYGQQDMQKFGGEHRTGWLVDTFGHISQAPQLHRLFDLEAVFVWRGVPQLTPYFYWQGADGQKLLAVNLFGGYRNLYGVTHAPEIAVRRLMTEVEKLRPFYPTPDIPLFDGYDLEQAPEDPMLFYRELASEIPPEIELRASTPGDFVREVQPKIAEAPVIAGELNSGKFGATFPGTLSTRTYLKIMNHDCEQLLFKIAEPLAAMAQLKGRAYQGDFYENWARLLLQNTVHDCICGVSIDQVHEKMEVHYRTLYEALTEDAIVSLRSILRDFKSGYYAVSTEAFGFDGWQAAGDQLFRVETGGIGVWPVTQVAPIARPQTPVSEFRWQNDHYSARIDADGLVHLNGSRLGRLMVIAEQGDTYSEEPGEQMAPCLIQGPLLLEERSDHHCVIRYHAVGQLNGATVNAVVRLTFDDAPLVRWQVDLDSQGVNFKVVMVFETARVGDIYAGMPFDMVKRKPNDRDLLPRHIGEPLSKVMMGQRELVEVRTFPYHDYVAIVDEDGVSAVMAKGIRAYQASEEGAISLILRRSVEWITVSDLALRAGDAGPFMYVPDARSERSVRHDIAVYIGQGSPDDIRFQRLNAGFQNPPMLVRVDGGGEQTRWGVFQEDAPLSSLQWQANRLLARLYNPISQELTLTRPYRQTDVWGRPIGEVMTISPKAIVTLEVDAPSPVTEQSEDAAQIDLLTPPAWRVGENHGRPSLEIIAHIEAKMHALEEELEQLEQAMDVEDERERLVLQHRFYVLMRELHELKLSWLLNQRKLRANKASKEDDLFTPDPDIAALGLQLNDLRIKRRIYDYVVEAI